MECKNCNSRIQEPYLYCPNCSAPSYASLYEELVKVDYFLSQCDTWLEEGVMEEAVILPLKERYLAKKQELLILLQASEEVPPIPKEDILRELAEKVIKKSFEKTKRIVEEDTQEIAGDMIQETTVSPALPETERTFEFEVDEGTEEEISLSSLDLTSSSLPEKKNGKSASASSFRTQEVAPLISDTSEGKGFTPSGSPEKPSLTPIPEKIPPTSSGTALTQEQMTITFLIIIGVFSVFFVSLHFPLSYYAPLLMLLGATGVYTGYSLSVNVLKSKGVPYLWTHPLTLAGYALTFLALLLSLKGLQPGVMIVTLTLAILLYILSAYVYKSSLFVYLSTLCFSALYAIALFQMVPFSLPMTCFAFIPLTVIETYLAHQYSHLENGKFSRPLYHLAFALSGIILLTTLGVLYYESAASLVTPLSLQTLFFPSQAPSYPITWSLIIFLTYSVLYGLCGYLYKRKIFIYLTNILLTLSLGIWISYLQKEFILPLSLTLLFLTQIIVIKWLEFKQVSKELLIPILDVPLAASLVTLGLILTTPISSFFNVVALLLLGIFYLWTTQIYPNNFLVYLASGIFAGGIFYGVSLSNNPTPETYGLLGGLLSLLYFIGAYFYEKSLQLKADLDLSGERSSAWQEEARLYSHSLIHSALFLSGLSLILAWKNPGVLMELGSFYLFLILLYPSKYWLYPAFILFLGSIHLSWIAPLPFSSWDSAFILLALILFLIAHTVQVSQRTLCQILSLPEKGYYQPLFNLAIVLFLASLVLYFSNLTNIFSDSYTLLLATLFCGLGFYLQGEAVYLFLLFLITFALNFSFGTISLQEINFEYLSLSSILLTWAWLEVIYGITQPSNRKIFEKVNLSLSPQARQTIIDIFYPLIFAYTLVSLILTLGQVSPATIATLWITALIYTRYAHIFGANKWLYGANFAVDVGVIYLIFWLMKVWTLQGNLYLITSYLSLSTVFLCWIWTAWGKYYEARGETPGQTYLKSFAIPHFFMAWKVLPIFVVFMSALFLTYVPSPQPLSFVLNLLALAGLTLLYASLAVTERQEKFLYLSEIGLAYLILFMSLARPDYFAKGRVTLWLVLASFVLMELGQLTKKYQVHMLVRLVHYTALWLPLMSLVLLPFSSVSGYKVLSLLAIAGFYLWVSHLQTTTYFTYLSLFLGNWGLFTLLAWANLTFTYSPQLYLVPLVATMIGIARLNKNSLSPKTFQYIRFSGTLFILILSYLEALLTGESWRIDFLMTLCIGGILLGLIWRIRTFLYLDTLFLSLHLLTRLLFYLYDSSGWIGGLVIGFIFLFILIWTFLNYKPTVLYLIEDMTQELSTWE
jgi:hypothetical protein